MLRVSRPFPRVRRSVDAPPVTDASDDHSPAVAAALPPGATVPPRARSAALVPLVPEVAELLGTAERVLAACAAVEEDRAARALDVAPALDPALATPTDVLGPGLPRPLADRVALRALRRLAIALHPSATAPSGGWWAPGGVEPVVEFRAVTVDARDRLVLELAAEALTHPRRAREGALREALGTVAADGEHPDDRHPAALGCLLGAIVPVDDADTLAVHVVAHAARGGGAAAGVVLGESTAAAHAVVASHVSTCVGRGPRNHSHGEAQPL